MYVMTGCSDELKSMEILNLRKYVRELHKDVRANNRVVGTLWDFIEQVQERLKFQAKGNTTTSNGKRKKLVGDSSDDDADYKATPIKKLGVAPRRRKNAG